MLATFYHQQRSSWLLSLDPFPRLPNAIASLCNIRPLKKNKKLMDYQQCVLSLHTGFFFFFNLFVAYSLESCDE